MIRAAAAYGGALPVIEQPGPLTPLRRGRGVSVADRLVAVQTPQAFLAAPLLAA